MGNLIEDKSFAFAVKILTLDKYLKSQGIERDLTRQILRSGTSIGANIAEAQQAQSNADFISKMNIALKDSAETKYWIRLFEASGYISSDIAKEILEECIEIEKILYSIIRTAKGKQQLAS